MQGMEKVSSKIHGIEILEHTDIPLCSALLHLEKDILNPGENFHPKLINSVTKKKKFERNMRIQLNIETWR